jgi:iron(III) transport system substrate-binding protein
MAFSSASVRALTTDEILNYSGSDRQKVFEDGARKEGTVTIYSGMIVNQLLRPLTETFEKKYPFIKTRYWRGDGNHLVVKVLAEMQANALEADVAEGSGISNGVTGASIVLPFHSPLFDVLPTQDIAPEPHVGGDPVPLHRARIQHEIHFQK